MSSKAMSLKGKIKNYAKSNNIAAQVVLQNYMFECFLARLSNSEYNEKFVVKGGMLIAAIVGLDTRSTMDLDTTLRNLPLTEEKITEAIETICKIDMKDDVVFTVKSIEPIRKDDIYGGYCVRLDAVYDTIVTPFKESPDGSNVTSIGTAAFSSNRILAKVTIKSKKLNTMGAKAFYGCKKLKKIILKTTSLKKVGKKAVKGIYKKATIDVSKKYVKKYKKLFTGKGFVTGMKMK